MIWARKYTFKGKDLCPYYVFRNNSFLSTKFGRQKKSLGSIASVCPSPWLQACSLLSPHPGMFASLFKRYGRSYPLSHCSGRRVEWQCSTDEFTRAMKDWNNDAGLIDKVMKLNLCKQAVASSVRYSIVLLMNTCGRFLICTPEGFMILRPTLRGYVDRLGRLGYIDVLLINIWFC